MLLWVFSQGMEMKGIKPKISLDATTVTDEKSQGT